MINNISSKPRDVVSDVLQGSILGPSLFLFYVNDIVADIGSEIRLFADGVIMYFPIKSATDITQFGNDIERLENWAKRSMMRFNVDKCCVMVAGRGKMEFSRQVVFF